MKKVLSFTLAVALAFSLLLGSAFASSGSAIGVVDPDNFISWGSFDDRVTLAVPSVATSGRNFIIYKVRTLLYTQYVIDSFDATVTPVEGGTYSFIRYWGTQALTNSGALEPSQYSFNTYSDAQYLFSADFTHDPVYSNFDYFDADGELIISSSERGEGFDALMNLTLNDGTVIQVPRSLQGQYFVVARSSSADQYKIWLFQPDQVESGLVYEGSTEALYFTSDGSFSSGAVVTTVWSSGSAQLDIGSLSSQVDFSDYPYCFVGMPANVTSNGYIPVVFYETIPSVDVLSEYQGQISYSGTAVSFRYRINSGVFETWSTVPSLVYNFSSFGEMTHSNFSLYSSAGELLNTADFSFGSGGWSWTSWLTMSIALDITQYGDIVYQSFNYSTSAPEESPSPTPDDVPDSSNNGLFPWLREQWVFLMGRLTGVIDAINALADKLDPFPDQTTPILKNFFNVVFPNRITDTDINNIDIALDRFSGWFDTGYTFADFFDLFNQDYFLSWFSDDTKNALDAVGGAE